MRTDLIKDFTPEMLKNCKLPIIVTYYNTKDFPNLYVARLFDLNNPTPYVVVESTLEALVELIPKPLQFMPRDPKDDSTILGSYL